MSWFRAEERLEFEKQVTRLEEEARKRVASLEEEKKDGER
jgi:hypothetical protein